MNPRFHTLLATLLCSSLAMLGSAWSQDIPLVPSMEKTAEGGALWPAQDDVAISIENLPLSEAVAVVCEEAGWGLMWTTKDRGHLVPLVRTRADPARVLEELLADTGFEAEYADGTVVVRKKEQWGLMGEPEDRVLVGKDLVIAEDEVAGDTVVTGGDLTVLGRIAGDGVTTGGDLHLGPGAYVEGDAVVVGGLLTAEAGARIDGDAVAIGGRLDLDEGVRVGGEQVSVAGPLGKIVSTLVGGLTHNPAGKEGQKVGNYTLHGPAKLGPLKVLLHAMAIFLLGLILISLAPLRMERMGQVLSGRVGVSALLGLSLLPASVVLTLFLLVSIIGIPLVPLLGVALTLIGTTGLVLVLVHVGRSLPVLGQQSPLAALGLGTGLFLLVGLIPVLGSLLLLLALCLGSGAVVLSRFGRRPARFGASESPRDPDGGRLPQPEDEPMPPEGEASPAQPHQ